MSDYDVVVIGAGPGGYMAAVHAAKLGLRTACVEKNKTLGGTCLNVGCIPSKALLHSTEEMVLSFEQMMSHKEEVVTGLVNSVSGLFKTNKVEWISGKASFINSTTIVVDGKNITSKYFIIATGSEPIALPFAPFDEKVILSSTGALSLQKIPEKMVVVGAGVIGVELASVYSRLGTKVTLIEMLDKICPFLDDQVGKTFLQILKKQGLTFHLGVSVTSIKKEKEGVRVSVNQEDFLADVVLIAVGRKPYTEGLGLEKIGIPKGLIPVNGNFQTSVPNIYAIGDVVDGPMLAHKASDEGIAAVDAIAGRPARINYMAIPNVIYTNPEVAALGFTEEEAKKAGIPIKKGISWFKANARARCNDSTDGFVKVIVEANTSKIIGVHIIGPNASEMIGEGVVAIEKGTTAQELASYSHAHPALSEAIKESCLNIG